MSNSSSPFDDFSESNLPLNPRNGPARFLRSLLRIVSSVTLWIAISTAIAILLLHIVRYATGYRPPWFHVDLKSAIPLILIGVSYSSLLFTLPRSPLHRFLGLLVGAAFILWGIEQFLTNRAIISLIDDGVVFLFVLDLSFVIREQLKGR